MPDPATDAIPPTMAALLAAQEHACLAQDWDEAIALGERILARDPQHTVARPRTAALYGWRASLTPPAERAGDDRAIADFARACELDPDTVDWYYGRGLRQADHGEYDQAIRDFTHAIALAPHAGAYYYERGRAYQRRGDRAAARRDFAQVVTLDRGYVAEAQAALQAL